MVRTKGTPSALVRLALLTKKARRKGDVICGLSQLLFDNLQKLETFLSTGGNKILSDRLVKVTGVISEEDGEPTDVYGALVGVGRFVNHYLGVRKGGPNVVIRASPGMGANDNFLTLEVCTRSHKGIAAHTVIAANFGVQWQDVLDDCGEQPAKRFRGMLESYFPKQDSVAPDEASDNEKADDAETEKADRVKAAEKSKIEKEKMEKEKENREKAEAAKKAEVEKAEVEKANKVKAETEAKAEADKAEKRMRREKSGRQAACPHHSKWGQLFQMDVMCWLCWRRGLAKEPP